MHCPAYFGFSVKIIQGNATISTIPNNSEILILRIGNEAKAKYVNIDKPNILIIKNIAGIKYLIVSEKKEHFYQWKRAEQTSLF